MSIIYILIPLAIILVVIAIGIFFWAVKNEQFKDLERHGSSILFDDDIKKDTAITQCHHSSTAKPSDKSHPQANQGEQEKS